MQTNKNKNYTLSFRVDFEWYKAFEDLVEKSGRKKGEVLREMLSSYFKEIGVDVEKDKEAKKPIPDTGELKKIGIQYYRSGAGASDDKRKNISTPPMRIDPD